MRVAISGTLFVASLMFVSSSAWADWQARVVARAEGDEPFAARPVQARVGEPIELSVVLIAPDGDVFGDVERARLGRRARAPHGSLPEGATVRWLEVVPRQEHLAIEPPNPGILTFSNNVLFGPDHGDWLGYDQLEYETHTLPDTSSPRLVVDRARRAWWSRATDGAGSNWFAVEVTLPDGTVVRSPDGDDVDRYGLSRDVLRVSFRPGDHFVDWLATYYNVPHLFGSAGPSDTRHQADLYIGADCADTMVGAWRAAGNDVSYTSVAGIHRYADSVTDALLVGLDGLLRNEAGEVVDLRWGEDVQRGDLVAIDFTLAGEWLPRRWDHIGALARDDGPAGVPDGRLNGSDVVRHMGRDGLIDTALWQFNSIKIRLWRWE